MHYEASRTRKCSNSFLHSSLLKGRRHLTAEDKGSAAEAVQGSALPLQGVDDVHGGDSFSLRMLGVGNRVADYVFQENFEDASRLFVDQTGDPLHSSTSGETTDSGLRNPLDVVTEHFTVTFGATLAKSFSTFATARHLWGNGTKNTKFKI